MKIKSEIIKQLASAGISQNTIAKQMGVKYQTLWKRQQMGNWKPEGVEGFVAAANRLGAELCVSEVIE